MRTYYALTIGPIYKTLQQVKSTKAIWSASYFFSYTMKSLIEAIKQKDSAVEFLMPFVTFSEENKINTGIDRVGLIPDRTIFRSENIRLTALQDIISHFLHDVSITIADDLSNTTKRQKHKIKFNDRAISYVSDWAGLPNKVEAYLKNYLQIYAIETSVDPKQNPVQAINDILDSLELQSNFRKEDDAPYLNDFFENIYYNKFIEEEFSKKGVDFPSSIEIATSEFRLRNKDAFSQKLEILDKSDSDEAQEKFLAALKNSQQSDFSGIEFKQRHKYISTVLADGDNVGFFIGKIFDVYTDENEALKIFKLFSQSLSDFAKTAVLLIRRFGGTCVYAGGDDLLFFAPVYFSAFADLNFESTLPDISNENKSLVNDIDSILKERPNGKSVFWLTDQLELLFKKLIAENNVFQKVVEKCYDKNGNLKKPSLSFGVNISYYKNPLNEGLDHAKNLLFDKAKKIKNKNTLAFHVLKHSGQYYGTIYQKSSSAYQEFSDLLTGSYTDEMLLASLAHKIDEHKMVLTDMVANKPELQTRLKWFFQNNFNEAVHTTTKGTYLVAVRLLTGKLLVELDSSHSDDKSMEKQLEKLYASLRFLHFLNADDKDE